jgi:hypothetical protein
VIPSHYGYVDGGDADGKKYYFGDNDVHALRPGMEIANPMADGIGLSTSLCNHTPIRVPHPAFTRNATMEPS